MMAQRISPYDLGKGYCDACEKYQVPADRNRCPVCFQKLRMNARNHRRLK